MTGNDWLAVLVLLGFVTLVIVFDRLRELDRRERDRPCSCWICAGTRNQRAGRDRQERAEP
jgi:hypothetical protein